MCQQFENEQRFMFHQERRDRRQKLDDHLSGKAPLTDDEIKRLMIEELMARDAGY